MDARRDTAVIPCWLNVETGNLNRIVSGSVVIQAQHVANQRNVGMIQRSQNYRFALELTSLSRAFARTSVFRSSKPD